MSWTTCFGVSVAGADEFEVSRDGSCDELGMVGGSCRLVTGSSEGCCDIISLGTDCTPALTSQLSR